MDDLAGLSWYVYADDRLVLKIPRGDQRRFVQVMRYAGGGREDMLRSASFARPTGSAR